MGVLPGLRVRFYRDPPTARRGSPASPLGARWDGAPPPEALGMGRARSELRRRAPTRARAGRGGGRGAGAARGAGRRAGGRAGARRRASEG